MAWRVIFIETAAQGDRADDKECGDRNDRGDENPVEAFVHGELVGLLTCLEVSDGSIQRQDGPHQEGGEGERKWEDEEEDEEQGGGLEFDRDRANSIKYCEASLSVQLPHLWLVALTSKDKVHDREQPDAIHNGSKRRCDDRQSHRDNEQ